MLINIEFGINQIRGRCNFTCIYHNNHHIKLSLLPLGCCWTYHLHGSFILTSFQHSPRCSLELINFKISSFLSSPFLSYISLSSLCFLSSSWEEQNTIARNAQQPLIENSFILSFFNGSSYNSFQYSFLSSLGRILPCHLQPVRI